MSSLFFIIEILCYGSKNDDFIMLSDDNALSSLWTMKMMMFILNV